MLRFLWHHISTTPCNPDRARDLNAKHAARTPAAHWHKLSCLPIVLHSVLNDFTDRDLNIFPTRLALNDHWEGIRIGRSSEKHRVIVHTDVRFWVGGQ